MDARYDDIKFEKGFYWVKVPERYDGEIKWEIAYYDISDNHFYLSAQEIGFPKEYFIEIDSTKLVHTPSRPLTENKNTHCANKTILCYNSSVMCRKAFAKFFFRANAAVKLWVRGVFCIFYSGKSERHATEKSLFYRVVGVGFWEYIKPVIGAVVLVRIFLYLLGLLVQLHQ